MSLVSKLLRTFNMPMVYLAGVLMLGSFGAGYGLSTIHHANAEVKEVMQSVQKDVKVNAERYGRDIQAETALRTRIDKLQSDNSRLKGILYAKADPDPNVYLRAGDVRLLDDAATGKLGPDPASEPAYQEQTPTNIGLRPFVGAEIDIRTQYRELAQRCDTLIDWVDRELVKPQVGK